MVELVDDLDGGTADEHVTFGLDGVGYEIDLSAAHAAELREAFASWIGFAHKVGRARVTRTRVDTAVDPTAVRAWARATGVEVSPRGRIPGAIVEQFRAAGH